MITKKEGIEELKYSGKRHDIKFNFDSKGNVYVYHGTSQRAADIIKKTSHFIDGFFFHDKSYFDSDLANYAEIRSKQNNENGGGVIMDFLVDPRCLLVNGAGETESDGDLYLDTDGVWKTKEYLNKNIPKFQNLGEESFYHRINDRMYYKNDKVSQWIWRTFKYYTENEKLDIFSAIKKMKLDFEYFENASTDYYYEYELIDGIDDIDEWITDKVDSGEYDSEEEVRDSEENIINGYAYKDMLISLGIDRITFNNIISDLLDDDIFNISLFTDELKEKMSYIKSFENFKHI